MLMRSAGPALRGGSPFCMKFGAIMALGCVARAGRAWIVVLHLAGKPSRESDGDSNPLRALPAQLPILLDKLCAGELIDVRGMTNTLVQRALLQIFVSFCFDQQNCLIVRKNSKSAEHVSIGRADSYYNIILANISRCMLLLSETFSEIPTP